MKKIKTSLLILLLPMTILWGCGQEKSEWEERNLFLMRDQNDEHGTNLTNQLLEFYSIDSGKYQELAVLDAKTQMFLDSLDQLTDEFVMATGGIDENGNYVDYTSRGLVWSYVLKNDTDVRLLEWINSYSDYAKKQGVVPKNLAIIPSEHRYFKYNPDTKDLTFAVFHFKDSNLIETLMGIELLKSRVLYTESLILNAIHLKVMAEKTER